MEVKIYLAARYSRRVEMCKYRDELIALGYTVVGRWLDGSHQTSDEGVPLGDHGEALVEGDVNSPEAAELRCGFACDDLEDLDVCDVMVNFTEPPRTHTRGGRHVEFGCGLVLGKTLIVVGYRETLFHWLPPVIFFETWEEAKRYFEAPCNKE